jgi:hypothetical protein
MNDKPENSMQNFGPTDDERRHRVFHHRHPVPGDLMKRGQMRRRPKEAGRIKRAEQIVEESTRLLQAEEVVRRTVHVAKGFIEGLERFANLSIPLPISIEAVAELVKDPLVLAVLEQREKE